ncbi:MAG: hypothetical protein OXF84_10540 [Bacteroidetes bacterium]|nr:hypothetical protein [Bacteroidota bacterium]
MTKRKFLQSSRAFCAIWRFMLHLRVLHVTAAGMANVKTLPVLTLA